ALIMSGRVFTSSVICGNRCSNLKAVSNSGSSYELVMQPARSEQKAAATPPVLIVLVCFPLDADSLILSANAYRLIRGRSQARSTLLDHREVKRGGVGNGLHFGEATRFP